MKNSVATGTDVNWVSMASVSNRREGVAPGNRNVMGRAARKMDFQLQQGYSSRDERPSEWASPNRWLIRSRKSSLAMLVDSGCGISAMAQVAFDWPCRHTPVYTMVLRVYGAHVTCLPNVGWRLCNRKQRSTCGRVSHRRISSPTAQMKTETSLFSCDGYGIQT